MMSKLQFSKATFLTIRERLTADHPDVDEQTLADTIEGLTDLDEVLAAIVRSAITDQALADGLRGRIGEMQARLSRLEDRAASRRGIARQVMVETQIKKITAPDFTVSVRPGSPGLVVTDENVIPENYWVAREPRLDRQSLHTDLKRGSVVAGVLLSNPEPVLSVRVR